MPRNVLSAVPILFALIFVDPIAHAAGPPIFREILEPASRVPVRGAFLEYSLDPVGNQLPMPRVLWRRMPRNEEIRQGGLLHVLRASRIQVTEFSVVPDVSDRDYVYLQIQFADGVFRELPVYVTDAGTSGIAGQVGEFLDRARFKMDGRSEWTARKYVGVYYFGQNPELYECGSEMSFILDASTVELTAEIEEATRHPAPSKPEDDSGRVYLELGGRRLGEFLGLQESGNADSVLLVEEVIRHSETDLCPDSGAG